MSNYKSNEETNYSKRTKHVHFISGNIGTTIDFCLSNLEKKINSFIDDHSEYKILGIKLTVTDTNIIAAITYFCDPYDIVGYYNNYDEED